MKTIHKILLLYALLLLFFKGTAQQTTSYTAAFLNLSTSSRLAALGSNYISVNDDDITVAAAAPSFINRSMDNMMSLSVVTHFSGSGYGSLLYGKEIKKLGSFVFGLQYVNYGTFDGYDEDENPTSSFTAADYMFMVGWGRDLSKTIRMGAAFKPVLSHYESYTAFAAVFDLALTYNSPNELFSATVMARNIGAQLVTFNGYSEEIPFELTAGLSYKLPKAPFRLYLTATELQRWNLKYEDVLNPSYTEDPFTGTIKEENIVLSIVDNVVRHTVVGVEFCPSKAFNVRLGYNYRRAKEMQAAQGFNFSGFSYGFGFRIKNFTLAYSRNNYHQGQAPNYITITMDFDRLIK